MNRPKPSKLVRFVVIALLAAAGTLLLAAGALLFFITRPSPACRDPYGGPFKSGTFGRVLASGGTARCYLVHIPPNHDPAQPTAVVLSLHGFASNPEGQQYLSGWSALADEQGFVAVYPQGSAWPLRWNAGPGLNVKDADDVQFLRDVLADLETLIALDWARIYINGMSNGAGMAHRAACESAEVFAATGLVAGAYVDLPEGCTPSRPMPVIAFHGTQDPLAAYHGLTRQTSFPRWISPLLDVSPEARITFPAVETFIQEWAARNGCTVVEPLPTSGEVRGVRHSGCSANAEVLLYTIAGGGHTWPGGAPTYIGKTSRDIDATQTMWVFFQDHPLPQEPTGGE